LREAIRTEDLNLALALPTDLLQDRPTPAPLSTSAGRTSSPIGATRVAAAGDVAPVGATVLSPRTNVAPTPAGTVVAPATPGTMVAQGRTVAATSPVGPIERTEISAPVFAPRKKSRSPWILLGIGAFLLLLVGGAVAAVLAINAAGDDPTPTVLAVVTQGPGETAQPTTDINAAISAALTRAAQEAAGQATNTLEPTATDTPEPTATPTLTPTPDETATYIAACAFAVELVDAYTFSNRELDQAAIGQTFPMNWILRNSGTCPWPEGLQWSYLEGEEMAQAGPEPVVGVVEPGGETTITTDLVAPGSVDTFEITWQLVDAAGEPFAEPLVFEVRTYRPATATPRPPTPTVGPTATPTGAVTALDLNTFVSACEYVGTEWRCLLTITPFGGGGGPYTVWVFDSEPPARYFGPGNQEHFITSRRCSPWVHEIRVQDEPSGQALSRNLHISPDDYFAGGCLLP
jgi:hypothetical protein